MTTIQFYHLLHTPLARALPKLMEKMLEQNSRAVVLTGSQSVAQALADALWAGDPASFLPNGMANEGNKESQPIYITWKAENPNDADVLVITDGSQIDDFEGFRKVLDMFDGANPQEVAKARERWTAYKDAGHDLTYIKQQPSGGWKAEA
jgi:DNA polymerase-3 subunit chi